MLTVKFGDKYPTYWTVDADLTGTTVRLLARRRANPAIELACSIVNPATAGEVEHMLDGTLPIGTYAVELEITKGLDVITAPTDRYENLRVIASLD